MLVDFLVNLAAYLSLDDPAGAAGAAREAIAVRADLEPDHPQAALAIEQMALAFAMRGDVGRAAMLEGYASAALAAHKFARDVTESTTASHGRLPALLGDALLPAELERLTAEGVALASVDEVRLRREKK